MQMTQEQKALSALCKDRPPRALAPQPRPLGSVMSPFKLSLCSLFRIQTGTSDWWDLGHTSKLKYSRMIREAAFCPICFPKDMTVPSTQTSPEESGIRHPKEWKSTHHLPCGKCSQCTGWHLVDAKWIAVRGVWWSCHSDSLYTVLKSIPFSYLIGDWPVDF